MKNSNPSLDTDLIEALLKAQECVHESGDYLGPEHVSVLLHQIDKLALELTVHNQNRALAIGANDEKLDVIYEAQGLFMKIQAWWWPYVNENAPVSDTARNILGEITEKIEELGKYHAIPG